MNVTRTLVTTLLISSIILGFVQALSTQEAGALFDITSYTTTYSTVTSTLYSSRYVATGTSTFYRTTAEPPFIVVVSTGPEYPGYMGYRTVTIPTATVTYFTWRTVADVFTYVTEFVSTIIQPSPGIGTSAAIVVLIGVVAAIVFVVVVYPRRKTSASTKPPIASEPAKREEIFKKPEKTSKFCRHCGAKIPQDSTFCEACGKKL